MTNETESAGVEVLPCPFCGGRAERSTCQTESLWSHDIVTYTQVGCPECDYSFSSEPGYEVEAPERWNTRTTVEAGKRELVEALREARLGFKVVAEEQNGSTLGTWGEQHVGKIDATLAKYGDPA